MVNGKMAENVSNSQPSQQQPPNVLSATEIGREFVNQYYDVMSRWPEKLHGLYSDKSIFVYEEEEHIGQQNIAKKFDSLGLKNSNVRLKNWHAMGTICGGVMIQVSYFQSCTIDKAGLVGVVGF